MHFTIKLILLWRFYRISTVFAKMFEISIFMCYFDKRHLLIARFQNWRSSGWIFCSDLDCSANKNMPSCDPPCGLRPRSVSRTALRTASTPAASADPMGAISRAAFKLVPSYHHERKLSLNQATTGANALGEGGLVGLKITPRTLGIDSETN